MPILRMNPGFSPDSCKIPRNATPDSGPLASTTSVLCECCQEFFSRPPRALAGHIPKLSDVLYDSNLREALSEEQQYAVACCSFTHSLSTLVENDRTEKCHLCVCMCTAIKKELSKTSPVNTLAGLATTRKLQIVIREAGRSMYSLGIYISKEDLSGAEFTAHVKIINNLEPGITIASDPQSSTSRSSQTFDLVKQWMRICERDHPKCRKSVSQQSHSPKRLLDVHEHHTGVIKLHTTGSGPYLYTVLSHCWGKSKKLLLEQNTESRFKSGIPLSNLAPTFQDAIVITARLGFRYLWIDCLCIIQDSVPDWETEASKMASVYGNASICISAAASVDSDGGCFRSRRPLDMQAIRFDTYPFKPTWTPNEMGPVFFCNHDRNESFSDCKGPLDARGWILQEQILSPRTIHYAQNQVYWECRCLTASEVWPQGLPTNALQTVSSGKSKGLFDYEVALTGEASGGFTNTDPSLKYHRWRTVVKLYSTRTLSQPDDKFPALSGIASAMMSQIQDDYVAGLWRASLLLDLAWFVVPENRMTSRLSSATYISPSWSWAAVNTPIEFGCLAICTTDMEAIVDNVSTTPRSLSSTGKISAAVLEITGLLRPSVWYSAVGKPTRATLSDELSQGWLDEEIRVFPDADNDTQIKDIFLLQLYRSHDRQHYGSPVGRRCIHGLILVPTTENNKYRRVGYFAARDYGYTKIFREGTWEHFTKGWRLDHIKII